MGTKATSESCEAIAWLNAVASGTATMSQRSLHKIKKQYGGMTAVRKLAKRRRVHLLVLEDDKGHQLVAASRKPFKVIC